MQTATFSSPPGKSWREGQRLEPHTHDAWSYWSEAKPRKGDTEARLQMRLATSDALSLSPRDPRFYKPDRELGWQNSSPMWSRFIPEYGITQNMSCIGQSEEHVRRPTLAAPNRSAQDFVSSRTSAGRRTTPLISYNSIGWNRRHYEPIPDNSRPHTSSPYESRSKEAELSRKQSASRPFGAPHTGSFVGSEIDGMATASSVRSAAHKSGPRTISSRSGRSIGVEQDHEPPRIAGVDTSSRPPLVVHSKTGIYQSPWIGTVY